MKKCVKIKIFGISQCLLRTPSGKTFIGYADLDYLMKKGDGCQNISGKPSTTKASEHIPSGFSIFTVSSYKNIQNKHDVYRGENFMKKFCECLRKQVLQIINFKKKEMNLLSTQQQKSYENEKICYSCK